MWKNIVDPERQQTTIQRMRFACWISKTTDTHSEYEILLSTATLISRTRLDITLYIHTLPLLLYLKDTRSITPASKLV